MHSYSYKYKWGYQSPKDGFKIQLHIVSLLMTPLRTTHEPSKQESTRSVSNNPCTVLVEPIVPFWDYLIGF